MENYLKKALKNIKIEDFITSGHEDFFRDNPVEFMKTSKGIRKNISAPHMLAILLHHLEIKKGAKNPFSWSERRLSGSYFRSGSW